MPSYFYCTAGSHRRASKMAAIKLCHSPIIKNDRLKLAAFRSIGHRSSSAISLGNVRDRHMLISAFHCRSQKTITCGSYFAACRDPVCSVVSPSPFPSHCTGTQQQTQTSMSAVWNFYVICESDVKLASFNTGKHVKKLQHNKFNTTFEEQTLGEVW